jgi:hypothetical protein
MNLTQSKIEQQIAFIRESADVFLIDKAKHYKRIGEEYTHGEAKPIFSEPVDIRCRLIVRSGSESSNIAAQARNINQTTFTGIYRMQIPYASNIVEGDRIVVTDRHTGMERVMDVVFSPPKHAYSAAVIIQIQEVK